MLKKALANWKTSSAGLVAGGIWLGKALQPLAHQQSVSIRDIVVALALAALGLNARDAHASDRKQVAS